MENDDEIFAFMVGGNFVCFNCYHPGRDKENVILTKSDIVGKIGLVCDRCKKMMKPDRRMINRRLGVDRRNHDATILAPDRRNGGDRRCRGGRRTPAQLMSRNIENKNWIKRNKGAFIP